MEAQQKIIAQRCLDGAYDNTISFPAGVQALTEAGFEGYYVDYRLNTRTYYTPNGETLVLENVHSHGTVGVQFNQIVSMLGRRVVYFGRIAETHVEHFRI